MLRILKVFSFFAPLALLFTVSCGRPDAISPMTAKLESREVSRLEKMVLLLKPSEAQQRELDSLVEAQQDPNSPEFHHWLSPQEFGSRFGASEADVARVASWLSEQGLDVDEIPAGGRLVMFSGSASHVGQAFRRGPQRLVKGAKVGASDWEIPSALVDVVAGVVSPHGSAGQAQIARESMPQRPLYSAGGTHYFFPSDFAAVYDLNPLYQAGTTGTGAGIAIAARSNIDANDVSRFRSRSGLSANAPQVVFAGDDPGLVKGDREEATLATEWAGALAPGAKVTVVVAASTASTDGIDLAAAYIVNHALAPVMVVSYAACEQRMSATELAFYNSLWEQAAAQGMSVLVASGDAGAAGCSAGVDAIGSGAAVNGICSSPYATCVGGTEFAESEDAAQYWAATNDAGYGSAMRYIPERVWNESAAENGAGLWASGGGLSRIYARPDWQRRIMDAAGEMRMVPDVSLAAAQHDGAVMIEDGETVIVSGTSVSAPAFAGIMALVVAQHGGLWQGNANPRLYALAGAHSSALHPTGSGNNTVPGVSGFAADGSVYNAATGLGSVDGAVLASEWAASQQCGSKRVRIRCRAWPLRMTLQ